MHYNGGYLIGQINKLINRRINELLKEENVPIDKMYGHGGFFKTKEAGQRIMAAALHAPVTVMETAGEGGAWGIALLADFLVNRGDAVSLSEYLDKQIFEGSTGTSIDPDPEDVKGFAAFIQRYSDGLKIERAAIDNLK